MRLNSENRELLWIGVSGVALTVIVFLAVALRKDRDPSEQLAQRSQAIELALGMRLDLAEASEEQNGAVLSISEKEAQQYVAQARAALGALERKRASLEQLFESRGQTDELERLRRVSERLQEFLEISERLTTLAVENSNREAFELATGPGLAALEELDAALERLAATASDPAFANAEEGRRVADLAHEIGRRAWRMMSIWTPHINEESDARMDELEQRLQGERNRVAQAFQTLTTFKSLGESADLRTAQERFAELLRVEKRLLERSRANTDVKSVALALTERRRAMLACQDALADLIAAVKAEPITSTIPARQ